MHIPLINVPKGDRFIVTYDERGRALAYITYDEDDFFWSVSIDDSVIFESYKELYFNLREYSASNLCDIRNIHLHRSFEASFVQRAVDFLEILKYTVKDWSTHRLSDFLIDIHGNLDVNRLEILHKASQLDVKRAVLYEGKERRVLERIILHLFDLAEYYKKDGETMCSIEEICLNEFESNLVTVDLRLSWFDTRDLSKRYFRFFDGYDELYFALSERDKPLFMFFLEKERDSGNKGRWSDSKAA